MRIDEIERELKETEETLEKANKLFAERRFKDAYPLYQKAQTLLTGSFGAEDSRTVACLFSLADTCYELRKFDEAAATYHQSLAMKERRGDLKDHEYPGLLFKLAKAYAQIPQPPEANKYFQRAALAAKELLLAGDPLLGNVLEAHADLMHRIGNTEEAEALRNEARSNRQKFGGASQVTQRYLEPHVGQQFQTIPPSGHLQPSKKLYSDDLSSGRQTPAQTTFTKLPKAITGLFIPLATVGAVVYLGIVAFSLIPPPPPEAKPIQFITPDGPAEDTAPKSKPKSAHKAVTTHAVQPVHKIRAAIKHKAIESPAPKKATPSGQWGELKQLREYN